MCRTPCQERAEHFRGVLNLSVVEVGMRHLFKTLSVLCLTGAIVIADDSKPGVEPAKDAVAVETATPAKDPAAPPAAEKPTAPVKKPAASAGEEVARVFPLDGPEWMKDPFLVLDLEMEAVVEDFGDGKAKPPAETTQPRIVSRFDLIIEQLEKKCSGSGGGNRPNKPADKSTLAKGPGGMGELKTPKKTGKGYDDLTPKEREKILQSKTEGFPPGFEDVLADYYRRLAKADGVTTDAVETPPAAASAKSEKK
jgi:hypothetical protein